MARDCKLDLYVAVKIFKAAPIYRDSAYDEAKVLLRLLDLQTKKEVRDQLEAKTGLKNSEANLVRILNFFTHSGSSGTHCCTVMELLGPSLTQIIHEFNSDILML